MSKVISVCTSKGGAGKTTLTIAIASAFAHMGAKCALIDTDPQRSLSKWASRKELPSNIDVFTEVEDDSRLLDLIEDARKTYQIVLIDVQVSEFFCRVHSRGDLSSSGEKETGQVAFW